MANILVSGLINTETTVRVERFPIEYFPVCYPFFGVNTAVSGVACNISRALATLGDRVELLSLTGSDFQAEYIRSQLNDWGISTERILPCLRQTPSSAVLYDGEGKRQIYCDLKDIQEAEYPVDDTLCRDADMVVACNINFNRPLLRAAKQAGTTIATDVHVLSDIDDEYNRDFMTAADILFLSDEGAGEDYAGFMRRLAERYGCQMIVMGRGSKGAAMYTRESGGIAVLPAVQVGSVVNTVGAGDALFSGFVHHYAAGHDALDALVRAQLFASAKICTSGAAQGFVTAGQLAELYDRYSGQMLNGMTRI